MVDVPNGVYEVTAYLGDPSLRRDRMVISAENQTSGQISTNRSTATWTRRVEVTDGQLTLRLRDLGGADRYASISGLTVTSVFVPPQMTIGDVTLPEPAPGTQQIAEFVVSLSKPFEDDVTVEYSTIDALAKAGLDYVAASGVLTIPAGQTSGTISVAVLGDSNTELRESFYVNLRNASGADYHRRSGARHDPPLEPFSDRGSGIVLGNGWSRGRPGHANAIGRNRFRPHRDLDQ